MKKSEKCIEMLEALGITDVYVMPAVGYWRQKRSDVYAWEWGGEYKGVCCVGGCWDTMTICAKAGQLEWNKDGEVWPVENT